MCSVLFHLIWDIDIPFIQCFHWIKGIHCLPVWYLFLFSSRLLGYHSAYVQMTLYNFWFIYVYESFAYMMFTQEHACCPQRPEDGVESPGIGVTCGCEPLCRSWELNPGPMKEQQCSYHCKTSPVLK